MKTAICLLMALSVFEVQAAGRFRGALQALGFARKPTVQLMQPEVSHVQLVETLLKKGAMRYQFLLGRALNPLENASESVQEFRVAMLKGMQTPAGKNLVRTALELESPLGVYGDKIKVELLGELPSLYSIVYVEKILGSLDKLSEGKGDSFAIQHLIAKLSGRLAPAEGTRLDINFDGPDWKIVFSGTVRNVDDVIKLYNDNLGRGPAILHYLLLDKLDAVDRPDLSRAFRRYLAQLEAKFN